MAQQPKNSKLANENTLQIYSRIVDFVEQLKEVFCVDGNFHEIELYNHLLSKTKLSNKHAVEHHVKLFGEFFTRNANAIAKKDEKLIMSQNISYSEKVYLNLTSIFNKADKETKDIIWNHLLVINALIDPTSDAKNIIQSMKNTSTSEGQFLDTFLTKIESSIDADKMKGDPMSIASSILQSGILSDMVGSIDKGVKSGTLDIGKLVGTMQGMLSGISGQQNPAGAGLDINGLMSMITGNMSGMGGGMSGMDANVIKTQIESKVEEELKKLSIDDEKSKTQDQSCSAEKCNVTVQPVASPGPAATSSDQTYVHAQTQQSQLPVEQQAQNSNQTQQSNDTEDDDVQYKTSAHITDILQKEEVTPQ